MSTTRLPALARAIDAVRGDRAAGIGMAAATLVALVWANSPAAGSYKAAWMAPAPTVAVLGVALDWRSVVDQALLVAFFVLVGLEIRREVTIGSLHSLRRAALPVLAGICGMLAPAAIYSAVVAGGAGGRGWGVPMATDVAFALGALALVGPSSPRARVLLMTLAVADDIGSVALLVAFYSSSPRWLWLAVAAAALVALVALWASRLGPGAVRIALVCVGWYALLRAGVDASVVGVALGACGPRRRAPQPQGSAERLPRVRRWELRVEPVVNAVVLPAFALANVGVEVRPSVLSDPAALRVGAAVVVARLAGKPLGILAGVVIGRHAFPDATRPRLATRAIAGVGSVATIGFTVPLLVIAAAFRPGPIATAATIALLIASGLGMLASRLVLGRGLVTRRRAPNDRDPVPSPGRGQSRPRRAGRRR